MKSKFQVNISKVIHIISPDTKAFTAEEGDEIVITKSKDYTKTLMKLTYFNLLDDKFLNVNLYIKEINPPTGHGAHWPLDLCLEEDDDELLVRHFNLENGLYNFSKV